MTTKKEYIKEWHEHINAFWKLKIQTPHEPDTIEIDAIQKRLTEIVEKCARFIEKNDGFDPEPTGQCKKCSTAPNCVLTLKNRTENCPYRS